MKNPLLSEAIKKSPVDFVRMILKNPDGSPSDPHPGQVELLLAMISGVNDLIVAAGRQWGKSVVLGWYVVWFALRYKNRQIYIVAPTLDQARIIYNEVARHFRSYPLKLMLARRPTAFPFPNIQLLNGTEVHARGANSPEYIRGKPAHLIIEDEAAFIKDGVHPNVIEPMLTVTGRMEGSAILRISTPFGQGDFYDGAMAAQKAQNSGRAKFFHYASTDNPHADKDRLKAIRDRYGEHSLLWQTEYMAEFADSDLSIFPWSDIRFAYENFPTNDKGIQEYPAIPKAGHRYVQGTDLANRRDYFVNTILDVNNPIYAPMVRMDRLQQKGYAYYKSLIRQNFNYYNSPRTLIDATSLGESVVEDLRDIGAEGYTYTSTSKYDIVHNLVRMFNEHRIGIPFDRDIIDELRFFQYEITPSKHLKMEAKQGHDDIVMSLALSGQLAAQPMFTGFFMPVEMNPYKKEYIHDDSDEQSPTQYEWELKSQ